MALRFPTHEDLYKTRAYAQAEKEGLTGREYYQRAMELYEQAVYIKPRFKRVCLEEELANLALEWRAVNDANLDRVKKMRKKIDRKAFALVRRCCSVRKRFTEIAKDYYKTYRNLRKDAPMYIA
ncbi:MAG: hypothetical protein Q8N99_08285 [Nanoarchaeota archaeon]|nr:hypothetical protein [Nanoarchaeota archaeon]